MLDTHNHSIHYKMYKSGKSWVFAGLISAGLLLNFGGETALADTPADSAAPQTEQVSPEKPGAQPNQDDPTTLSKSDPKPDLAQDPEDNNPTEPENSQPDNDPVPSDDPDKNITPQDNGETNPSNLHKNNYGTSGDTTGSLNKTPGDSDVPAIKQTAPKRPQSRLSPAPGAPTPAPAASPVAVTAPTAEDDESIDVWMPNKTLQQMVSKSLGKSVDSITKEDMKKVLRLSVDHNKTYSFVNGTDSFSLAGLKYATNLEYLDLDYNDFQTFFYMSGDLTDISELATLTSLTHLDISGNKVRDISALASLTNLTYLDVTGNQIYDFSSLDASQFSYLNFGDQLAVLDPVTIATDAPSYTVPPLLKLPKNLNTGLRFHVPSDYHDDVKEVMIYLNMFQGTGIQERYVSGGKGTMNADGSVTFTDIQAQTPRRAYTSPWGYQTPASPYTYYLHEDIVSTDGHVGLILDILIPYDNPQPAANLTVHYVDMASTKPIQPDKVITGKLTSDTYDLTAEETSVKGYTFDHADGALTGNFTADPLTVTLYFTKDPTKPVTPVTPPVVTPTAQTTVTAHYVDQNGKTVHADQVLTGHAGDSYSTTAFTIPGYDLTTTPENASGTFGDTDTTVTYVYSEQTSGNIIADDADPTAPVQPSKPAKQDPTTGNQAATIHHPGTEATNQKGGAAVRVPATTGANRQSLATPAKSVAAISASKTTLPQTNEHRVTPLLGIALLLGAFLGFGLKRKQH